MKDRWKKFFSLFLCLVLLTTTFLHTYANPSDTEDSRTEEEALPTPDYWIRTVEDFLIFSQQCRLDTFSQERVVSLECDLDLTGTSFEGIPTFGGVFLGNNHKITGLSITVEGSVQGLFRYLQETAVVQELTVVGNVEPQGSRGFVGGIVGHNKGKISNCIFDGNIAGGEDVGGIAGYNAVTGIIENCDVRGNIHGDHFVGGIAGENNGVIRTCTNNMTINTTPVENSVDISDITMDTLVDSESVTTITDVGGIAGSNCGVIRSCMNHGNVGYRQMGYNIGGIAGSQMGYIVDCSNFAEVSGRKEVGGIVGQMEPATKLEYHKDTLQILQGDLEVMSQLTDKTSSDLQSSSDTLNGQMSELNAEAENASQAIDILLGEMDTENGQIDRDSVIAATNNLSASLSTMSGITEEILAIGEQTTETMTGNLSAVSDQMSVIGATIGNAADGFGTSFKDVSDEDTAEDTTGKVESCFNFGNLIADMTVGGIVGNIAMESDLDPEEDIEIVGETSLNSEIKLRAVVLLCDNKAKIECKKQYGGGIAGQATMGLIKDCNNSGDILGASADYIGGIAGASQGCVRNCNAKCTLKGASYVGGVLGTGTVLTDSRSMVVINGREKVGHIMGYGEMNENITGNYYLTVKKDLGAVDGISYELEAQPLKREAFFALEGLPDLFKMVSLTFIRESGEVITQNYDFGIVFTQDMIPAMSEKEGFICSWSGVEEHVDQELLFDQVFYENYTPYTTVVQSEQLREKDFPMLLVEGEFEPEYKLKLSISALMPKLSEGQSKVEGYSFRLPDREEGYEFRYLPQSEKKSAQLLFMVYNKDGEWKEATHTQEGSYYIFHVENGATSFCVIEVEEEIHIYLWIIAGVFVVSGVVSGLLIWRRRRKK